MESGSIQEAPQAFQTLIGRFDSRSVAEFCPVTAEKIVKKRLFGIGKYNTARIMRRHPVAEDGKIETSSLTYKSDQTRFTMLGMKSLHNRVEIRL